MQFNLHMFCHIPVGLVNPLKANFQFFYTLLYRSDLSFLLSDIRTLWRTDPSARVSERQKFMALNIQSVTTR